MITGFPTRLLLLLAALALASCQTLAPLEQSWPDRQSSLRLVDSYQFSGRLLAARAGQSVSAGLDWRQRDRLSTLQVRAPLGMGSLRVESDGDALRVDGGERGALDGPAAREALRNALGFDPPLAQLRYWLIGLPDDSLPSERRLDADQRLAELTQAGWTVSYLNYQAVGGRWLPQRLKIARDDWRLQLAISHWRL